MQTDPRTFYSDGLRLSGAFFNPDGLDVSRPAPLVVPCSGFTGLMNIHPARFARALTAAGHRCFAFDYRGFAESEGERGRVVLEEQVRDIRSAVAYASAEPGVDPHRIVLLGWGMGGGLVLDASRGLTGIVGLIAANGFYDGARVQRAHRGEAGFSAFLQRTGEIAAQRARTGENPRVDPFEIYPLDTQSREYVDTTLRTFEHYDTEGYTYDLAESLLRWRPEVYAPFVRVPLLIAHGDRNRLHPVEEATSLYERYAGEKVLFWIEGAGHTEFMHDDDPKFRSLAARVIEFVERVAA